MKNDIPEFFAELKNIRLEKKLTLKQISQSTKIHIKYLEALEAGNILSVPQIYDKLFFKAYLKSLDLSESDYYEQFLAFRKNLREDHTSIVRVTQPKNKLREQFNYKNILYFLPFVVAILLIWFLISNTLLVNGDAPTNVKEIDVRDVANQILSEIDSVKTVNETADDSVGTGLANGLKISIVAIEKTWFRVIVDEMDTLEYIINPEETIQLQSDYQFEFIIGKADGIIISSGEKEYGPFGKQGQIVKYMHMNASGITDTIISYPKKIKEIQNENEL